MAAGYVGIYRVVTYTSYIRPYYPVLLHTGNLTMHGGIAFLLLCH